MARCVRNGTLYKRHQRDESGQCTACDPPVPSPGASSGLMDEENGIGPDEDDDQAGDE
jgi:hypothetical protein